MAKPYPGPNFPANRARFEKGATCASCKASARVRTRFAAISRSAEHAVRLEFAPG
jgi:hypothetical protein